MYTAFPFLIGFSQLMFLCLIGVVIAIVIIVTDKILEAKGADFRMPVLAVAVGIYLPLELTVPIFVGGLVAYFAGKVMAQRGASSDEQVVGNRNGLLFAAGLITGEALVGIALAIPFAAAQSTDVLRLAPDGFDAIANVLGIASFVFFVLWLYRVAKRTS